MGSYNQFCRHCRQLIPGDAQVCPFCQRVNPLMSRCPRCQAPTRSTYRSCTVCGLTLEIQCPQCGQTTFFDDYCRHCSAPLTVECPNPKCRLRQAPLGDDCRQCGKPLKNKKEK